MGKTVKVKFGVYVSDGGDGSVYTHIVSDEAFAEKAVAHELEACGQAFSDGGASSREITVDVETGKIVDGLEEKDAIWDEED